MKGLLTEAKKNFHLILAFTGNLSGNISYQGEISLNK